MRALEYLRYGEPKDVVALSHTQTPILKDNELLIDMIASPVHDHDFWTIRGLYGLSPNFPAIGGSEAIGFVSAVGSTSLSYLAGRRVNAKGNGTWAEQFVSFPDSILEVPDSLSDQSASQLVSMPFAASSLLRTLSLGRGDWLIQNAANGAVGTALFALGTRRGINVLNLVRSEKAATQLDALGISPVLRTDDPEWAAQARTIVGKAGARAAVDSVGGKSTNALIKLLGHKGTLAVFGSVTGNAMVLQAGPIVFKQITVKGFWGEEINKDIDPSQTGTMLAELIALAEYGEIPLKVDSIHNLDRSDEAFAAVTSPDRDGKVLICG